MEDKKLNRLVSFDEKSRNYPITALLGIPVISNKTWKCETHLDQGNTGQCVGHAWAHELNALPYKVDIQSSTAKTIYYAAQQWDEWAGTLYDGTSVLAGAKVVSSIGLMPEYRWAFGIDDVINTLSAFGPVVLGINWYKDMFTPDVNGLISPTGIIAGGHAILATGIQIREKVGFKWVTLPEPIIRLHNSWGTSWGVNGDAFITASNLSKLLQEQGEACVPVKRKHN